MIVKECTLPLIGSFSISRSLFHDDEGLNRTARVIQFITEVYVLLVMQVKVSLLTITVSHQNYKYYVRRSNDKLYNVASGNKLNFLDIRAGL
jgi:hypothetical protein